MVWLHHFFTMGAGGDVNAIFGTMTQIIAVPTGVKIFNWLFTMYGGRVRFETPMIWAIGFMITFVIGGLTGVLLAVPPADFMLHNSLFLVAHFHNVIIGGVVFGAFAGYSFWFPKVFGFRLDEGWARRLLVLVLRLLRRLRAALCGGSDGHDAASAALRQSGMASVADRRRRRRACHLAASCVRSPNSTSAFATAMSCATRPAIRGTAASLEWSTSSPPPAFNFAVLPHVEGGDPYWLMKQRAIERGAPEPEPVYQDIEMPRNSATGVVCAFFAAILGFSLLAHLVARGLGVHRRLCHVRRLRVARRTEYRIPAAEVARIDRENRAARRLALAQMEPAE